MRRPIRLAGTITVAAATLLVSGCGGGTHHNKAASKSSKPEKNASPKPHHVEIDEQENMKSFLPGAFVPVKGKSTEADKAHFDEGKLKRDFEGPEEVVKDAGATKKGKDALFLAVAKNGNKAVLAGKAECSGTYHIAKDGRTTFDFTCPGGDKKYTKATGTGIEATRLAVKWPSGKKDILVKVADENGNKWP
ncbi:hypothetical protein ITI46_22110 [Streptomyces oryzae]|uniref:Lipoprotein n=1 Tax=Streptomyces oryzae TaxID=1434886 RepID=A0ABS3XG39_9ACTN|nr:hypothetical protein [Streptomyces oryzae]MBO8194335.1 hypothetical protein [Streptomyces oryzae]